LSAQPAGATLGGADRCGLRENMAAFYPALAGAQGALKKILGNCEKTLPFSRKMVYNNSATWGLVPKAAGK
jgi:hypothetical protein